MKRLIWTALAVAATLVTGIDQRTAPVATLVAQSAEGNAYFDALVARSDHWKSFSLRAPEQMLPLNQGGYAFCNSCALDITYNPAADTDAHKQDAAKVVIPAFNPSGVLSQDVSASEDVIHVGGVSSSYFDRQLKIDDEIVTIPATTRPLPYDKIANTVTIVRGQFGTRAVAHSAGATVEMSVNSIRNQIHLPLYTIDGHSYLFTWDAYYTDSWVNNGLTNLKTFQFSSASYPSGNTNTVFFEVDNRVGDGRAYCTYAPEFDRRRDVSVVGVRSYNALGGDSDWSKTDGNHVGPGIAADNPMCPVSGIFIVRPNRWTRYWVRVDQRANDYDYFDMWVADEFTEPVKVYSQVPMSIRATGKSPNSIHKFWFEFNTSTNPYVRGSVRDFVTYLRNFVALQDVRNVDTLLIRPTASPRR